MSRLLLALVLRAAPVEAEDGFVLAWDAPAQCPDQIAVEQRITALLSASNVASRGEGVRARGHVEVHDTSFRLELQLEAEHRDGVRRIESESCEELAHAAALIVSIAIDPSVAASAADPIEAPSPDAPAEVAPVAIAPAPVTAPGRDDERAPQSRQSRGAADAVDPGRAPLGFGLHAGAGLDALLWRPLGASLVLGAALIGRGYRIELDARYAVPITIAPRASLDTRVQQWSLGMDACAGPRLGARRRAQISFCGGVEVGALHGRGVGAGLLGRRTRVPWLAVSVGPRFAWAFVPRVALWVGVEGVVTLARPRLVTDEGTLVLQPGRAGLRALAGLELRFAGALQ